MCHNTYLSSLDGLCFVCCRKGIYPTQNKQEEYPTKQMSEGKWTLQLYPVALQILNLAEHRAPPTCLAHSFLFLYKGIHCLLHLFRKNGSHYFQQLFLGNPVYSNQSLHRLSTGSELPLLLSSPAPSSPVPIHRNPARCSLFMPSLSPPKPSDGACASS